MIGRAMESWPDDALQKVADSEGAMGVGSFRKGCLLATAFGWPDGIEDCCDSDLLANRWDGLATCGRRRLQP